jgi:hypothetical protein
MSLILEVVIVSSGVVSKSVVIGEESGCTSNCGTDVKRRKVYIAKIFPGQCG